ncbi:hypothetical protein VNO77_36447 [Canavalia gladiata]|uniref:Uncharacterized protein n=1 Tax=Canavalia gladiata TaxID=3824 RepID=A0AAN9PUC0_CANGL
MALPIMHEHETLHLPVPKQDCIKEVFYSFCTGFIIYVRMTSVFAFFCVGILSYLTVSANVIKLAGFDDHIGNEIDRFLSSKGFKSDQRFSIRVRNLGWRCNSQASWFLIFCSGLRRWNARGVCVSVGKLSIAQVNLNFNMVTSRDETPS